MKQTIHEKPGVYSSYDASTVVNGGGRGKIVGLVGDRFEGAKEGIYKLSRYEEAVSAFGEGSKLAALTRLILLNGAAQVYVALASKAGDYTTPLKLLGETESIAVMVCDSDTEEIQQKLRQSVLDASAARRERIGVVSGGAKTEVAELVRRAATCNCERMVMVAPEGATAGVEAAAAVAGVIASEPDPAIPLGGAAVKGVQELAYAYTDSELDLLIRGGVTPLETLGGQIYVVRGVTTRTKNGQVADATWRELTTIQVVDDVIPAVRDSLRAKFQRAKNTTQSRGAIRAQVVLELENKLAKEIISGYDGVKVEADLTNPTVCLVDFSFTVTHGLNQIWLSAHITV